MCTYALYQKLARRCCGGFKGNLTVTNTHAHALCEKTTTVRTQPPLAPSTPPPPRNKGKR